VKILFFNYDINLIRNNFILEALNLSNEQKIVQIRASGLLGKFKLILFVAQLFYKKYDYIYLGMGSHPYVLIAKIPAILRRKKIIFDAFVSVYNTEVEDRKRHTECSLRARYLWYLDKYSCLLSNIVILDTYEHISYFQNEFNLSNCLFRRVLIGSYENKYLNVKTRLKYDVLFFGNFIPLQGVETIVESASLIDRSIKIHLIGDGQTYSSARLQAENLGVQNIIFHGSLSHDNVMQRIMSCKIGLGIFGNTEKAKRVIPHKAYEIIASRKPLLTGDSLALREIFTPGEDCLVCQMSSAHSLATTILNFIEDENELRRIAYNGYKLYNKLCTPAAIGNDFTKRIFKR
jgi:glycosyltransferase involved in cell wall biosynthesis